MAGQDDGQRTTVTFLGTEAVVPECGGDTASFVINGRYLVDTGWYAAIKMRCFGIDPMGIEYLFLTHCHHDHYIGLPHLLFYLAMRAGERPGRAPLKIVGPAGELELVVGLAQKFLQMERFAPVRIEPELIPLRPGDAWEDPEFALTTCASLHPVPGLCYRFADARTGAVVAFTGDTAYEPSIPPFVAGADLLVTEASYGASPAPAANASLHSGAPDAARMAIEGRVKRLALVHCPRAKQAAALAAAQALFPNALWPADGEVVTVG
jgi:ribonuclease Z